MSTKEFKAQLLSTADNYRNDFQNVFSNTFQNLVTKIGLIISDCSIDKKMVGGTFLYAIDFLCNKVLENPTLYNVFRAIKVNENSNINKHTLGKTAKLELSTIINNYNDMLHKISTKYKLNEILNGKIYNTEKKKTNDPFKEKKSVKYENISGNKLEFRLSPFYESDKFNKTIKVQLSVSLHNTTNDTLFFEVRNSHRTLSEFEIEGIKIKANGKKSVFLTLKEEDVKTTNSGEVYVDTNIEVQIRRMVSVEKSYEKGLIFKKTVRYHIPEPRIVDSKVINLKQFLKEGKLK